MRRENVQRERRPSHRERMLDTMGQLQNMDMNDAQLAALFQKMDSDKKMLPSQIQSNEAQAKFDTSRAGLAEMEARMAPGEMESKALFDKLRGIGDVGQGLAFSNPELGADVIQQLLQRFNLYTPDPQSGMKRKAAEQGMSLEQYQQLQQKLMNPQPKK